MKKGKKVLSVTLAVSMALACLTACNGKKTPSGDAAAEKTPTPTAIGGELSSLDIEKPATVPKNADAQKVTLKVWCPAEERNIMEQLTATFNDTVAEYDITFDIQDVSEANAFGQIKTDPKKSGDVFMFGGDQIIEMTDNGFLLDITEAQSAGILTDEDAFSQYADTALKACQIDGKTYAFPFTPNQYFLYYDNALLTEEDVKSLNTIMEKDLGDAKNFSIELGNGWYISSFFYAGGCTLFGDGTKGAECDWNNEKGFKVVQYLRDEVVKSGKFHSNSASDDAIALMKKGQLASWANGSWKSNAIRDALGKERFDAAVLPSVTIDGVEGNMQPFADYKLIGVNSMTDNPGPATKLAYFLADDYAQTVRLKMRYYAPTITTLQDIVLKDESVEPDVKAATEQITDGHCVARPTTSQLSKYWKTGETLGSYIVNQKDSVEDANLQKTLDAVVKAITAGAK